MSILSLIILYWNIIHSRSFIRVKTMYYDFKFISCERLKFQGVCVVWLKKSLKLAVEGEILAARLGPMLEKYLLKLVTIEVGSEISSPLLLKQEG